MHFIYIMLTIEGIKECFDGISEIYDFDKKKKKNIYIYIYIYIHICMYVCIFVINVLFRIRKQK